MALGGYRAEVAPGHEFELAVRLVEGAGIAAIRHIHEPLINAIMAPQSCAQHQQILEEHLQRRGYADGKVVSQGEGKYRLWYGHQEQPLVSIIIPTKDQIALLVACVTSLMEKTHYQNYEILIVDNNSETPEAKTWLKGIEEMQSDRLRVLRYPWPFNYSAINNHAAEFAKGDYLVLLNNDTAIIDGHWLDALLNHGLRPEVGVTGARLLYPDGKIQHAGVVLGLRGPAEHPFNEMAPEKSGYMQRLQVDQNYSVVSAACLLVRKSVWLEAGGLDETQFQVSYNDVDFCLKVRELGYLTVWTPHSLVMHEGSVSQKSLDVAKKAQKLERFRSEQDNFYRKWLPVTTQDPAYNANLALNGKGFELNTDSLMTWQPLDWRPLPVVAGWHCTQSERAYQRIIAPLNAMKAAGLVEGMSVEYVMYLTEVAKYQPESLVIQRQLSPDFQHWLERLGKVTSIFKVLELDENLARLPLSSPERNVFPGDIGKLLRDTLRRVDRVVVTTEALAEALRPQHSDIVVMSSLLTPDWQNLSSRRGMSKKARIGINSFGLRNTDMALITELIREFAESVEWVLIGPCAERIKPWLFQHLPEIETSWYPAKLALLNLDLALAPLEGAAFNIGKGTLRLMEYGACAVPVICSDVEGYRGELRVTRVNNRISCWREAIMQHLSDPEASGVLGQRLQQQVRQSGIMNVDAVKVWSKAWLAG
ncbi:glycosyltransferase family 2 protein [Erwinia sp. E_sp_B04_7]